MTVGSWLRSWCEASASQSRLNRWSVSSSTVMTSGFGGRGQVDHRRPLPLLRHEPHRSRRRSWRGRGRSPVRRSVRSTAAQPTAHARSRPQRAPRRPTAKPPHTATPDSRAFRRASGRRQPARRPGTATDPATSQWRDPHRPVSWRGSKDCDFRSSTVRPPCDACPSLGSRIKSCSRSSTRSCAYSPSLTTTSALGIGPTASQTE